ncbi:DUF2301 domain-containing membrane protein [Vibrio parahaemolyticus]|uniref:DUF2301 domain-containing membrane protein n=1 Tax=Vibrio TaxID=662 RepID=UPI0002A57C35|nr:MULTISPECIES: DUF2301 domain-containing membrane protein [Vibrio]RFD43275.1 hypothetical protein H328_005340 [Vibrio parahaemolyticus 3355]AGB11935.1 Arabinose efflux permease [Vibrio parahaemolyticus BB22OP]AKU57052.1 Arabinose efflux permease [Vibrio parahaemolyticus]AOV92360.1 membrane protein [Vibrio parahaemolyticus]APE86111.1 Arabinose efflux permease [Vibrio parahaemolyticus]
MANTEHQETLDFLDKLSVCLYRAGISVFAIALLGLAALESQWLDGMDGRYRAVFAVFTIAGAMSASNIHVYSKSVRTIISWSGWIGAILMVCDPELNRVWLALGFIFVTFSGIALKESFCFKVLGLKLVPTLLVVTTFALWFEQSTIVAISALLAGLIMAYLSIAKWRMPLHFDIGIKANYEV